MSEMEIGRQWVAQSPRRSLQFNPRALFDDPWGTPSAERLEGFFLASAPGKLPWILRLPIYVYRVW